MSHPHSEPEHPLNFSYPPIALSEAPPGTCPNPPWMYIQYDPHGRRVCHTVPHDHLGPRPGFFHIVSAERGALMCRAGCEEGSACEMRLREFFVRAGEYVGWRGDDAGDLVWRVMEAVEGGELDRYGLPIPRGERGREYGYSERYRR